jgi:hypothetical protein
LVVDNEWFFDTELLVVAERAGLRICEVPVDWTDDPNSSVHITDTAIKDLQGVWRMLWSPRGDVAAAGTVRQVQLPAPLAGLLRTTRLGVAGMAAYATLFILMSRFLPIGVANLSAVILGVGVSAALHFRRTRDARATVDPWPGAAGVAVLLATSVAATTAILWTAAWIGVGTVATGLTAATLGMAGAALARFLISRSLVFRTCPNRSPHRTDRHPSDSGPESDSSTTKGAADHGGGRSTTLSLPLDAVDFRPIGTDADVPAHR